MVRMLRLGAAMLTEATALMGVAVVAWSAESAEARKGGTLRLGTADDVESLDPALSYLWGIEFATCAMLFSYPDAEGAAGTQLVPEVVKTSTVSRDRRTYDFGLKRTFRFHTGAPVTARSFADAFNRDAHPRLESPAKPYMREIAGAVAVMEGKAPTISGVRVLDRYRLRIRLTRPVGDFTARLALPFFCPVLPNTPIVPKGIDDPGGSGPYYLAERIVNRRTVLRRNPHYGGGRPANVDQILVTVVDSDNDCLLAVEQNQIDICASGVPPEAYRRLAAQYGINRRGGRLFVDSSLFTAFLAFNHDRPAFKGPGQIPLKKAINYAIDRPNLVRAFGYLAGRRTDQLLPPSLGRDERIYPLEGANLATARKWYARAKHKPPKPVLYTRSGGRGIGVAETLEFNLKQIGIDLEVKYYDFFALNQKAGTRGEPFDIMFHGWIGDYPDPAAFFGGVLDPELRATGNANTSYYSNPRVTARMDAANRLTGTARRKAWADLDADLMRNDPPWAPFLVGAERNFVSRSFGCFLYHPVYGVDLAAACKK